MPTLQPGDVVVFDNLAAHKQPEARVAIEQVGALLAIPAAVQRPTSIRSNWPSLN